MKLRAYWRSIFFKDTQKFPYGLSRSGVFSLSESQLLESKGSLFKALLEEQVFDPTEQDMLFVKAIKSGHYDFSDETKVWAKYMSHQRRIISISGGWISTEPNHDEILVNELQSSLGSANDWDFDNTGGNDDEFLQAS